MPEIKSVEFVVHEGTLRAYLKINGVPVEELLANRNWDLDSEFDSLAYHNVKPHLGITE